MFRALSLDDLLRDNIFMAGRTTEVTHYVMWQVACLLRSRSLGNWVYRVLVKAGEIDLKERIEDANKLGMPLSTSLGLPLPFWERAARTGFATCGLMQCRPRTPQYYQLMPRSSASSCHPHVLPSRHSTPYLKQCQWDYKVITL